MKKEVFDIKKYKSFRDKDGLPVYYVMHCRTKNEAYIFCRYLHSHGLRWCDGYSYIKYNGWNNFKENTCYRFGNGTVGNLNSFKPNFFGKYIILEFSGFDWNTNISCKFMTKKEQERCE